MANITELLSAAIAEGRRIQETPSGKAKKASTSENGVPKPSTWEFLVDTLVQAGAGAFLHLSDIIPIMTLRGWKTKSASKIGTYRTVHSSTYKACRDQRQGHIARADEWINRSLAKDGLYALKEGVTAEQMDSHSAWIEAKEWKETDEDGEQAPADESTPQGSTPQASPEERPETDTAHDALEGTPGYRDDQGATPDPVEQEAETDIAEQADQGGALDPVEQETQGNAQGRRNRRNRARK